MKASSCPNLNRVTTSFPNFFTLFQDPDHHHHHTPLKKSPKIDKGDDTEASMTSPFKDILSSFVSFDETNDTGYLPDWDQEDQTLAKWPPSPNESDTNVSVGSNQFNPDSPEDEIHRSSSFKMSESAGDCRSVMIAAGFFGKEEEEVDAWADDFINRFKQQLKLQRLDSLLRYRRTLRYSEMLIAEVQGDADRRFLEVISMANTILKHISEHTCV